jgi:prepilin-type processing-associated H-X9-DG protein
MDKPANSSHGKRRTAFVSGFRGRSATHLSNSLAAMKNNSEAAFSRLDVLAILSILGLLTLVGLPVIGAIAHDANADLCQNNQRQLMRAVHLYCADNSDFFPYNSDNTSGQWITHNAATLPDSTNVAKLFDPTQSFLANYLNPANNVFKCPSDTNLVTVGANKYPRARSISMNLAVGTRPEFAGGKFPVDGGWLDGNHTHTANRTFRCYARLAEIINPPPSQVWIFLDEHPGSINDGVYSGMGPQSSLAAYRYIDWPATYHNNGAGFVFADGHAETKAWTANPGSATSPPTGPGAFNDIDWIARHTTGLVANEP